MKESYQVASYQVRQTVVIELKQLKHFQLPQSTDIEIEGLREENERATSTKLD